MTFTEAALEVLERMGREMHAREIAEKSVEWNLLSHVGKTPVQTMSARISAVVAKGPGKGPFVRVRPGVFALASWDGKPPGPSRQVPPAPPKPVEKERREEDKPEPKSQRKPDKKPEKKPEKKPAPKQPRPERQPKASRNADPAPAPAPSEENGDGTRKRKRRRRKKRSDEVFEQGQPQSQAPNQTPSEAPRTPRSPSASDTAPAATSRRDQREAEITDRAEALLRKSNRPVALADLSRDLNYGGHDGAPLMEAVLLADGLDREYRGLRPRFVQHRSGWTLAEREVSSEIVSLERQISEATERLGMLAERQVLRRLRNLPERLFNRVVTLYLRRAGFGEMSPVERNVRGELHLSVQDRRGGGKFGTAVVIRRDPSDKPISDNVVSVLRGSLHRYGSMRGMIITSGTFDDRARTEAAVPNVSPMSLIDGELLAQELVRLGIGVRERKVSTATFDDVFFNELGN